MNDQPDLFNVTRPSREPDAPARCHVARKFSRSGPTPDKDQRDLEAAGSESALSTVIDIRPFPLAARIGKIRDVARKLVATKSERQCGQLPAASVRCPGGKPRRQESAGRKPRR
jgi:hypothetical protein